MLKYKEIKQLGKVITGKTPPTEDESNFGGSIPFITPSDIKSFNEHYIVDTERTISESGSRYVSKNILPNDSICFVCIGSTIGKMCMTGTPSYTNQQLNSIIPFANVDNHYLFYLLRYFKGYFQLLGGGTGSGKGIVKKSTFEKSKVLYDDNIDNQKKIASILSAYDSQIENNKKRIKLLEQMAENLYKEWFVRFRFPGYETAEFEGGVPKGWRIEKLKDVSSIVYGFPFNSSQFCSDASLNPVVRIRDIADKHTETYTSEKPDDKYLIHTNDVLIGMDGIFHMNIWTNDGDYLNQRVVKVTSTKPHLSNLFIFQSIFPQVKMLESIISGTTVAHLSAKDMCKMTILIPDKHTLELSFSKFESMMAMRNKLLIQNDLLTTQRDLLLPRLMSGKLSI